MFKPTRDELRGLDAGAAPVYCELLGDQLTPVSAFLCLARNARHAFLLESVVGGEKIARFSFVGAAPAQVFQAFGHRVTITDAAARKARSFETGDPLSALETLLRDVRAVRLPATAGGGARLPRFTGGAVGYAAYDAVRYTERLPSAPPDDRGLPELEFGLYDTMTVFDHVRKTIVVLSHAHVARDGLKRGYDAACRRIRAVIAALRRPVARATETLAPDGSPDCRFTSNLDRARFERAVRGAIEYIRAGDIFQVVLSQRLRAETRADPFDVYRALRVVNPSPFMFFLRGPSCTLIGASPEILCRVEDGLVTSRPLAGTRPRGRTDEEDAALERALLADPKDRAEHIMLVDLGRNDVGRVAQPGTVALSDVMTIERYSHVMHICSNVQGRLAPGRTAFDALRAALPVGTVSGAPKVRAMEIIDEFEPMRRGPYGGAVGYVDFSGNMDTCIALRTMVVTPQRRGRKPTGRHVVDIQAGAGIVADSNPAAEYEETMNKARALLTAVALAESGFGARTVGKRPRRRRRRARAASRS